MSDSVSLRWRSRYLVAEADGQLVERHGVGAVSSEENLQLDGLVHMETRRLEPGLTLDCRKTGEQLLEPF